jgi:hypothetical protein
MEDVYLEDVLVVACSRLVAHPVMARARLRTGCRMPRQPKQSPLSNSLKIKPLDKSKKPSFKEMVQSRRIEEAATEDKDTIESCGRPKLGLESPSTPPA